MNDQISIDEMGIDTLCEEMYKYADQMMERIDSIERIVDNIGNVYGTDSGIMFINKLKSLSESATISCKNIISYAEDLATVKARFQKKSSNITDRLESAIKEIDK